MNNMSLLDAIETFEKHIPCTDAFGLLDCSMQTLIETDNQYSAVYFVIQVMAQGHYRYYEDQSVCVELSSSAKNKMLDYLHTLQSCIAENKDVFAALSLLIDDYFNNHRILHQSYLTSKSSSSCSSD